MASYELPPGWESRKDQKTGKTYYLNHYLRTTTWDDPRKPKESLQQNSLTKSNKKSTEVIHLQELSNGISKSPRVQPKIQESSFSVSESDDAIAKIRAMFPTVSETHIKLLMKNFRYMKSIFPKADETVILEVLYSNDNNIQKTSEFLKSIGYERKPPVKIGQPTPLTKIENQDKVEINLKPSEPAKQPVKTLEDKMEIKSSLKLKHETVPDQLIDIALESVEYDFEKASNLLKSMMEESSKSEEKTIIVVDPETENTSVNLDKSEIPISQSRQSLKSLLKTEKCDKEKNIFNRINENDNLAYKSKYLSNTKGHDTSLAKGNNEKLLLEEYVKWQGPERALVKGPQSGLAFGPNPLLRNNRSYRPCGPNLELQKGPSFGLAKNNLYNQMRALVVGGDQHQ